MEIKQEASLLRSKSTGYLDELRKENTISCVRRRFCGYSCNNRNISVSFDDCSVCGSDVSEEGTKLDSGIDKSLNDPDADSFSTLERKVDKLSEMLYEQHNLLKSIKEDLINSKIQSLQLSINGLASENNCVQPSKIANETTKTDAVNTKADCDEKTPAESLLSAIELKNAISLDRMIREALENFLQSDDVKDHVACVTADCVKGVIRGSFCRIVSNAYLPLLERSHRRLLRQVTRVLEDSFAEPVEERSSSLYNSVHKTSRTIRMALERHQSVLETNNAVVNLKALRITLKEILELELKEWRARVAEELRSPLQTQDSPPGSEDSSDPSYADYSPISPPQPADPERSIIDTLMKSAEINKQMSEGDINGSFEKALSSADLALVMAACRAADPAAVFAPCLLRQPVLLSLVQQLATDMVHDTQLKCRYLEEAMIHLNKTDATTRTHLPLVVGEVRAHLTRFLVAYPKHLAARRIALIVMAADNLLK